MDKKPNKSTIIAGIFFIILGLAMFIGGVIVSEYLQAEGGETLVPLFVILALLGIVIILAAVFIFLRAGIGKLRTDRLFGGEPAIRKLEGRFSARNAEQLGGEVRARLKRAGMTRLDNSDAYYRRRGNSRADIFLFVSPDALIDEKAVVGEAKRVRLAVCEIFDTPVITIQIMIFITAERIDEKLKFALRLRHGELLEELAPLCAYPAVGVYSLAEKCLYAVGSELFHANGYPVSLKRFVKTFAAGIGEVRVAPPQTIARNKPEKIKTFVGQPKKTDANRYAFHLPNRTSEACYVLAALLFAAYLAMLTVFFATRFMDASVFLFLFSGTLLAPAAVTVFCAALARVTVETDGKKVYVRRLGSPPETFETGIMTARTFTVNLKGIHTPYLLLCKADYSPPEEKPVRGANNFVQYIIIRDDGYNKMLLGKFVHPR